MKKFALWTDSVLVICTFVAAGFGGAAFRSLSPDAGHGTAPYSTVAIRRTTSTSLDWGLNGASCTGRGSQREAMCMAIAV